MSDPTPSPTPEERLVMAEHMAATIESLEADLATWRQRAEEAEEVVGITQLYNERLREALDILIDIINSAMQASESRAHKANDIYEEAVFAQMPPFADTANTALTENTAIGLPEGLVK